MVEETFQRYAQPPQYELYDLASDFYELHNLAYRAVRTEVRNALQTQARQ